MWEYYPPLAPYLTPTSIHFGIFIPRCMDFLFAHIGSNVFKVNEARNFSRFSISKIEEDRAFQFLKKNIIPKVVEYINNLIKLQYSKPRLIKLNSVLNTLRKTNHIKSHPAQRDEITYEAESSQRDFKFLLAKNGTDGFFIQDLINGEVYPIQ
jgi:hypothetical protein